MSIYSKNISPAIFWLAILAFSGAEFRLNQWECLLVMFAALELVPRGLQLLGIQRNEWYPALAMGLCAAYFFPGFWYLSLPYLAYAVWMTLQDATALIFLKKRSLADWIRLFALGYWATGAAFAGMYLADIRPFAFDPVIVSLTSAHFHLAGFVLAVLIHRLITENPSPMRQLLGWASLAGMPLVAAGITLTKLGYPAILEQLAALGFVLLALLFVWQQIQLALDVKYSQTSRWLWLGGVSSLLAGIALAGTYALRFQIPIEWVSIPNMKLWHGTLNTLGFAWLSLLAWDKSQTTAKS
jgi:hypothetical protein